MTGTNVRFEQALARGAPLRVGILVFPGVEALDFAGPFEVFSVAGRLAKAHFGREVFAVATVAADMAAIEARHGLGVMPGYGFAGAPQFDVMIVPGGVVDQPVGDADTLAFVRRQRRSAALTASVCTGAFILARIGVLTGLPVTTHWEDIGELRRQFPDLDVREDVPFVDNGAVITSAGISAGIGMSLYLVGRILGPDWAEKTARQMQYDWVWPGIGV